MIHASCLKQEIDKNIRYPCQLYEWHIKNWTICKFFNLARRPTSLALCRGGDVYVKCATLYGWWVDYLRTIPCWSLDWRNMCKQLRLKLYIKIINKAFLTKYPCINACFGPVQSNNERSTFNAVVKEEKSKKILFAFPISCRKILKDI